MCIILFIFCICVTECTPRCWSLEDAVEALCQQKLCAPTRRNRVELCQGMKPVAPKHDELRGCDVGYARPNLMGGTNTNLLEREIEFLFLRAWLNSDECEKIKIKRVIVLIAKYYSSWLVKIFYWGECVCMHSMSLYYM